MQRGHQNCLENQPVFLALLVSAGLKVLPSATLPTPRMKKLEQQGPLSHHAAEATKQNMTEPATMTAAAKEQQCQVLRFQ